MLVRLWYTADMPAFYSVQVRTHTGSVREVNEDAVSTVLDWRETLGLGDKDQSARGHLFALSDGMGGHAAGDIASDLVIETLFRTYYDSKTTAVEVSLAQAIKEANRVVCDTAEATPEYAGMGATLVAVVLRNSEVVIANVGDSRGYLFRDGQITQITRDHSWVAEQVSAGVLSQEKAIRHPYRNVITRSLGPERDPTPDYFPFETRPGDLLLLCTDGLSNLVADDELTRLLGAYPTDQAADILLEQALERGAPDNVTFVLIDILGEPSPQRRVLWPWLLIVFALIIVSLFILRENLTNDGQTDPTPTAVMAGSLQETVQNSPVSDANATPTPSPMPVPTLEHLQADPLRVAEIELPVNNAAVGSDFNSRFSTDSEASNGDRGWPQRDRYVYYLQGIVETSQADSDAWSISIQHWNAGGQPHRYTLIARGPWTDEEAKPVGGDEISIIAWPASEDQAQSDIVLEPLVIMDSEAHPLWMQDGDFQTWATPDGLIWVFSVYGEGGTEGLGVEPPAEFSGHPVALWGSWDLVDSDAVMTLHFFRADQTPYELQGDVYRQPDN